MGILNTLNPLGNTNTNWAPPAGWRRVSWISPVYGDTTQYFNLTRTGVFGYIRIKFKNPQYGASGWNGYRHLAGASSTDSSHLIGIGPYTNGSSIRSYESGYWSYPMEGGAFYGGTELDLYYEGKITYDDQWVKFHINDTPLQAINVRIGELTWSIFNCDPFQQSTQCRAGVARVEIGTDGLVDLYYPCINEEGGLALINTSNNRVCYSAGNDQFEHGEIL